MAGRNPKKGLDWFKHDVHYTGDEDIEVMIASYGNDGYAFALHIYELAYRTSNGELDISDAEKRQVYAKKCLVSIELWDKMLQTALKYGIFDKEAYEKRNVVTSKRIKESMKPVLEKRENAKENYEKKKGKKKGSKSAAENKQKKGRNETEKTRPEYINKRIKEYPMAMLLTDYLIAFILDRNPKFRELQPKKCEATRMNWFDEMRLLLTEDKRPFEEAKMLLGKAQTHYFWKTVILSARNFRKKYDQIYEQFGPAQQAPQAATGQVDESNINYAAVDAAMAKQGLE
jgi:hypothetical protein